MRKEINLIKRKIAPILKQHGVAKAGIFGSYATGKATKNSDVDVLVQFRGRKSLFDLAELELELEEKTKKKFDVLTYKSVNPHLKKRILGEEVKIL